MAIVALVFLLLLREISRFFQFVCSLLIFPTASTIITTFSFDRLMLENVILKICASFDGTIQTVIVVFLISKLVKTANVLFALSDLHLCIGLSEWSNTAHRINYCASLMHLK